MKYHPSLSKERKELFINTVLSKNINTDCVKPVKSCTKFFKNFNSLKTIDDKYKVAQLVETEIAYFKTFHKEYVESFALKFNTTSELVLESVLDYVVDYYKALSFYNITIIPVSHPASEYFIGSNSYRVDCYINKKDYVLPKNRSPFRHYVVFMYVPVSLIISTVIELGLYANLMEFNDDDFDKLIVGKHTMAVY